MSVSVPSVVATQQHLLSGLEPGRWTATAFTATDTRHQVPGGGSGDRDNGFAARLLRKTR